MKIWLLVSKLFSFLIQLYLRLEFFDLNFWFDQLLIEKRNRWRWQRKSSQKSSSRNWLTIPFLVYETVYFRAILPVCLSDQRTHSLRCCTYYFTFRYKGKCTVNCLKCPANHWNFRPFANCARFQIVHFTVTCRKLLTVHCSACSIQATRKYRHSFNFTFFNWRWTVFSTKKNWKRF